MSSISPTLRESVLQRLGFTTPPPPHLDGLKQLYHAWCKCVPFDNVRKMVALSGNDHHPLPGGTAADFFSAWLADGTGGTCWSTSNALYQLLCDLGFPARRIVGQMRDLGLVNHASIKVSLSGSDWLVDTSLLHQEPLPLHRGIFIQNDPVFGAEVEPSAGGTYLLWAATPPNTHHLPCRLLDAEVTHDAYLAGYEASRERSPFNQRLYARCNRPGELIVLLGNSRFVKTASGVTAQTLTAEELCAALHRDMGISARAIESWARSGALKKSFEPPSGPKPPPVTGLPPSRRSAGQV